MNTLSQHNGSRNHIVASGEGKVKFVTFPNGKKMYFCSTDDDEHACLSCGLSVHPTAATITIKGVCGHVATCNVCEPCVVERRLHE
jgi:hypothetical protein